MSDFEAVLCEKKADTTVTKKKLVFVCTGNTCRSPMAAALYNHLFADGEFAASSAGLYADGSPISDKASAALMERGVLPTPSNDYRRHVSRNLDEKIVSEADLIVGISGSHAMEIMFRHPAYASKIAALSEDVPDPYGGDASVYRTCLDMLERILTASFGGGSAEGTDCE
ncbi:MAG: low molecular weight protein arginine phosphatase [Clostridia bacterium]|nr:low molecular weight protein arginine phosphatase [Clostridia bacterium]